MGFVVAGAAKFLLQVDVALLGSVFSLFWEVVVDLFLHHDLGQLGLLATQAGRAVVVNLDLWVVKKEPTSFFEPFSQHASLVVRLYLLDVHHLVLAVEVGARSVHTAGFAQVLS